MLDIIEEDDDESAAARDTVNLDADNKPMSVADVLKKQTTMAQPKSKPMGMNSLEK